MLGTDLPGLLPVALLCAYLVGLSKGGLPVVGMLSVPILSFWINPLTAAALLLPIYLVSDVYGIWLYRKTFSARNLAILIPSGVFGVVIGYLTAPYLSLAVLDGAVGAIGVFYCLRQWVFSKPSSSPTEARIPAGVFWGTLSGLTSFVSHAGGPPFQVYVLPQKLPKLAFAGTATITFAVINLAKLPPYLALDQFPEMDWLLIFWLISVALFGAWSGAKLTRRLPETIFFTAIQIALFALSLHLIWRALTGIEL
ncbi:MAG: putative membrane protein YfcA [Sulfitobacter sp.]|jgi:uncharacterized membrane protein YfcA